MLQSPPETGAQDASRTVALVRSDLWAIAPFLMFTLLLSAVFWALSIMTRGSAYYTAGLMWAPALSAMLALRLRGENLASLGLSTFGGRNALIGYCLPFLYCVIAYGEIWMFGLGSFPNLAEVAGIRSQLGWRLNSPIAIVLLYVLLVTTTGMVPAIARALGEEIGWRGFLAPQLAKHLGFRWSALITGLIWTAWHLPIILFGGYHSVAPRSFALSCFTVMVVGLSFILTWLRMRSGSVWPCAIMHASHNILVQAVFTRLTTERGAITAYAVDEFGFAVPAVVFVVAVLIWRWWPGRAAKFGASNVSL